MTIIHCSGHTFVVNIEKIKLNGQEFNIHKGFICEGCDLKVKNLKAASYLEGKTS